jgi:hypothetical protein
MQQDKEKYFDDRIRRKLQEEESYPAPPFEVVSSHVKSSGSNWLRGFFMSDLMLFLFSGMLALNVQSGLNANGRTAGTKSVQSHTEVISSHSGQNESLNSDRTFNSSQDAEPASDKIATVTSSDIRNDNNKNDQSLYATSNQAEVLKSSDISPDNHSDKAQSDSHQFQNLNSLHSPKAAQVNSQHKSYEEDLLAAYISSPSTIKDESQQENLVMMTPLGAELNHSLNHTIQTRELTTTPQHYYKPFTIDAMFIAEKTLGYNTITPDIYQLKLNMAPDGHGYGAGLLFNYRIANHFGLKAGIETIRRNYNLKYNYVQITELMWPDSGTVTEILTSARSVTETELRVPFMLSYTLRSDRWIFEGAAGVNIKFKNLTVRTTANNQIPAEVLSAVEVGNSHLVTSGWMGGVLAGYQLSNTMVVFLNPYFQAETFGKSSRQFYTGRAVSGAGLKAGVRFHFNRD